MAPVATRGTLFAVATAKQIIIYDIRTETWKIFAFPLKPTKAKLNGDQNPSENPEAKDFSHVSQGTCLDFSKCGSLLVACSETKQLVALNTSDLSIIQQWEVPRKISTLKLCQDGKKLAVADKAGDVYIYDVSSPAPGQLILGHLSIVLDMVLSPDERFVLTSDRDEKIRTSHFPNSYNIHNFCLGHTEFVSAIALLPSIPNTLISGSGDGTLRIWDYLLGKELHVEPLQAADAEEKLAVRSIAVSQNLSGNGDIAAVTFNKSNSVKIYQISLQEGVANLQSQTVELGSQPLSITIDDEGNLYVVKDDESCPLLLLAYCKERNVYDGKNSQLISLLSSDPVTSPIVRSVPRTCTKDISPYFKRWFDNVQAYHERKTERLKTNTKDKNSDSNKRLKLDPNENTG